MKLSRRQLRNLIKEEHSRFLQESMLDDIKSTIVSLDIGYYETVKLVKSIYELAASTNQSGAELVALFTTLDGNTLSSAYKRNGITGIIELLTQRVKGMGADARSKIDILGVDSLTELPSIDKINQAINALGSMGGAGLAKGLEK